MEIFGVGPLELLLILVLGLIVLGPERLPEVGRFLGKQLARLMAWQQQSPEAQMIQQIRSDFEREIVSLRDELVHARQQMNVAPDLQKLRNETQALLTLQERPPGTRATTNAPLSTASSSLPPASEAPLITASSPLPSTAESSLPTTQNAPLGLEAQQVPSISPVHRRRMQFFDSEDLHKLPDPTDNGQPATPSLEPSAADPAPDVSTAHVHASQESAGVIRNGEYPATHPPQPHAAVPSMAQVPALSNEALLAQLQVLMADMQALQEQLKARGILDTNWQPPSHALPQDTVPYDEPR